MWVTQCSEILFRLNHQGMDLLLNNEEEFARKEGSQLQAASQWTTPGHGRDKILCF